MAFLVACGNGARLQSVIEKGNWEKVILITDGNKDLVRRPGTVLVTMNLGISASRMKELLVGALKPLMKDQTGFSEVAVNICSGNGNVHMALVSAMMELGVGFRMVDIEGGSLVTL